MNELSVFVDESGSFGEVRECPSYYLVTFVFHNQKLCIDHQVAKLENSIKESGFRVEYIHTGPVIRREDCFVHFSIDERRHLLYKMLNFLLACPITHFTVSINRREASDFMTLSKKLKNGIEKEVASHQGFFSGYDRIIVYYDNGQNELSDILKSVFKSRFSNVEFRKAEPQKYRLLQAADFVCSLELLRIKREEKRLSKSEEQFFYKSRELKKVFLDGIDKKRL